MIPTRKRKRSVGDNNYWSNEIEVLRNDEGERIVSTTEKNDISDNSEELIDMIPRSQY